MQLQRADAFAMRDCAASNVYGARRTARLHAERDRGKVHDHAFDQRLAGAAESLEPRRTLIWPTG